MGPEEDLISRRNFLVRALKTGLTGTLVAGGGILFYDPDGPIPPVVQAVSFPDFTISGIKKKLCIVHGPDRKKNLRSAFQALGGMESFIRPKDRVLIKVNAAFATPPQLGATTHPELVSETVRMCIESGAAYVAVTDNPINDPQSCFELTGIGPAARQAGAHVILPDPGAFELLTVPNARLIRNWPVMVGPFEGITRVIGMAPVKDHQRSGASMTLKNWYGLLGGRRNIFHQDIHTIIQELSIMIRPSLVILDGVVSMVQNGPTGGSFSDLRRTDTLIVGTDPVAVDAVGAGLLQRSLDQLPFLEKAEAAGAGTVNYESLNPIRINAG